jgi:regulator of replication initiation timing
MSTHLNIPDLTNILANMEQRFVAMQQQIDQHSSLLSRLEHLEAENKKLNDENENLRQQLLESRQKLNAPQKLSAPQTSNASPAPKNGPIEPKQKIGAATKPSATVTTNAWTEVVKRKTAPKPKVVTKKQKEAISRGFNAVSGPQGFTFVYINRSRRYNRTEVRKNLRLLGVEASRVLDVMFPARDIIGLLVHVQFEPVLKATLAAAKVAVIDNFDPTSSEHLADPKYATQNADTRTVIAMGLHRDRCLRALEFLKKKEKAPVGPVAREFLSAGWIDEEDIAEFLAPSAMFGGKAVSVTDDSDMEY